MWLTTEQWPLPHLMEQSTLYLITSTTTRGMLGQQLLVWISCTNSRDTIMVSQLYMLPPGSLLRMSTSWFCNGASHHSYNTSFEYHMCDFQPYSHGSPATICSLRIGIPRCTTVAFVSVTSFCKIRM